MEDEIHLLFTVCGPQINGDEEKRPVDFTVNATKDEPLRRIEERHESGERGAELTRRRQ